MFNEGAMNSHEQIIERLGGPAKVARMLGIADEKGAIQRVSNWKRRGIPPRVLLEHPKVFKGVMPQSKEASHA